MGTLRNIPGKRQVEVGSGERAPPLPVPAPLPSQSWRNEVSVVENDGTWFG